MRLINSISYCEKLPQLVPLKIAFLAVQSAVRIQVAALHKAPITLLAFIHLMASRKVSRFPSSFFLSCWRCYFSLPFFRYRCWFSFLNGGWEQRTGPHWAKTSNTRMPRSFVHYHQSKARRMRNLGLSSWLLGSRVTRCLINQRWNAHIIKTGGRFA